MQALNLDAPIGSLAFPAGEGVPPGTVRKAASKLFSLSTHMGIPLLELNTVPSMT